MRVAPRAELRALRRAMAHFIDIGANLTDDMFRGVYNGKARHASDVAAVLARARDAGVTRVLVTAGTLQQSEEALKLAHEHPSLLWSTVGVHPTRGDELAGDGVLRESALAALAAVIEREAAGARRVVAVGECGLDYDRTHFCKISTQRDAFEAQFVLAERFRLPMFLHDRNTGGEFVDVLRRNRARMPRGGVVHSFTGSAEELSALLELGVSIGLNGCSLKSEQNLQVARRVPLDRLMIETDSPYCQVRPSHAGAAFIRAQWPVRDKAKHSPEACVKGRCEPCHVRQVVEVLARARGEDEDALSRAAFNNAMRMFFPDEAAVMGASPYDWSVNAATT